MQYPIYVAHPAQPPHVAPIAGQSLEPQRCVACGLGWPIAHFCRNADGTRDLSRTVCQRCGEPDKERIRWQKMKGRMLKRRNDARNTVKARNLTAYLPSPAHMYVPQRKPAAPPPPVQAQVPPIAASPPPPLPQEPTKAPPAPRPSAPRSVFRRNVSDRRQLCLSALDTLSEPSRAQAWIGTFFQPDPLYNANQIDVFTRYQQDFAESPGSTLPGADFINLIPQVYPSVHLTGLRSATDQPGHFICIGFKEKPIAEVRLSSQIVAAASAFQQSLAYQRGQPSARPHIAAPPPRAGALVPQSQTQMQASGQPAGPIPAHWETQQAALAAYRYSQAQQAGYLPPPERSALTPGYPSVLQPPNSRHQPSMTYSQASQPRPSWAVDSFSTPQGSGAGPVWTGTPQSAPMDRPGSTRSEWAFLLDQRRGPDPTPQLSETAERVITDMAVVPRRSAPTTPRSLPLARPTVPHDIIEID